MIKFKDLVNEVGIITTPNTNKSKAVVALIRKKVKEYVEINGLKSLVMGVSGGLDSAVVAALCQEQYTGVPLIGVSIPMSSTNAHKEQAQWVGDNYCTAFEEFKGWDNNNLFSIIEGTDSIAAKAGFKTETFPKNVLQGNMKARLRMITIYDLARKTNGMVLSTDNLSELQMGFWTICGDVGDFGPIQNIGKGFELPEIARELGIREDIITQAPSDGLMVTEDNTDEAQLGASYKEVDTIMYYYLNVDAGMRAKLFQCIADDLEGAKKISNVINRYESLTYKRNGTVNLQRNEIGL
jgi:nicotinamide-nucleotide amidase